MRRIVAVIVGCAFVSAIGMGGEARQAGTEGQGQADRESIQGTWKAERRIREGKEVPIEARPVLAGDHFAVDRSDGSEKRGTFKLGPEGNPKTIDLMVDDPGVRGKIGRAIYELDGETLRICSTSTLDSDRPTTFESKGGDGKVVEVFRRVKAPDEGAKTEGSPDVAEHPAPSKDREALLDELDEVRVREEVQKMRRDAARQWIQQQVQVSGMGRFGGGMGGGGRAPQEGAGEHRKAVERTLKEAETEYLKTSKELAKIARTRSELERRVGEETPSKPKGDRAANDQIHTVGEVVRQVQDEVARFSSSKVASP